MQGVNSRRVERKCPVDAWPVECLESHAKFGRYIARFYPLLPWEERIYGRLKPIKHPGARVETPDGEAQLINAMAGEVWVLFEDDTQYTYYPMREVWPSAKTSA